MNTICEIIYRVPDFGATHRTQGTDLLQSDSKGSDISNLSFNVDDDSADSPCTTRMM